MNQSRVHLIGAGGIGVSAVGKYYLASGANVSGSDLHLNRQALQLQELGATVVEGNGANLIDSTVELIVFSPAVPENHPERQKAKELNIPELSYPQFLGELSRTRKTVAISGTNGKSTTTAMIAKIFIDADYEPMVFLGTESPDLSHGNFHNGKGVWLIVEACEYKEAMQLIKPHIAVLTNIELDHLDYYKDLNHIISSFQKWIDQIGHYDGHVILNGLDENSKQLKRDDALVAKLISRMTGHQIQSFNIEIKGDPAINTKISASIVLPGEYNAENATLAAAAAKTARISEEVIKDSLSKFSGTWRRFEFIGHWQLAKVYSDYAHHPTAIKGLLQATKEQFPGEKITIIFEPHQHARTAELFDDFTNAFQDADKVIICDIYGVAGRTESEVVSSEKLVSAISEKYPNLDIAFSPSPEEALRSIDNPNGLLLIAGAGTIDENIRKLL
jgi:UDP-N-acetylmuramate--alanine ligase